VAVAVLCGVGPDDGVAAGAGRGRGDGLRHPETLIAEQDAGVVDRDGSRAIDRIGGGAFGAMRGWNVDVPRCGKLNSANLHTLWTPRLLDSGVSNLPKTGI
jgi:hypothetical protein